MNDNNKTYLINKGNSEPAIKVFEQIEELTKNPNEVNFNLLIQIIRDNEDTEYGKKYNFKDIKTYDDYVKNVPVVTYEELDPYIERMANGEPNILTAYPFSHFTITSGTIGKRKKIPMTDKLRNVFMNYNYYYPTALYTKLFGDEWMKGRIFATTQGTSYTLPSGLTVGDASSVLAKTLAGGKQAYGAMMNSLYTSPVEASIPEEGTDTKYLMSRFAIEDKEVRGILCGYSSMVNHYLDYIVKNYELLINDIEKGTISDEVSLTEEDRKNLLSRIKPNPERAKELREIFKDGPNFKFIRAIWPNFMFVNTVCTAAFNVYYEAMKERFFDEKVTWVMSGITASEGTFSFVCDANSTDACLSIGGTYMEFLPVEAGDDFSKIIPLEKVELGKVYELIITNVSGYYRYRMEDCVQIVGYHNKTPLVRYMYRSSNCLNINIEKTTEAALTQAITNASKRLGIPLEDYACAGNMELTPPRYDVMIQPYKEIDMNLEICSKIIDEEISKANEEYDYFRKVNNIAEAKCYFLQPQTSFLYRDIQIMKGASASQIKPVHIIRNDEQKRFFYKLRDKQ